jgi:hypothetical protein
MSNRHITFPVGSTDHHVTFPSVFYFPQKTGNGNFSCTVHDKIFGDITCFFQDVFLSHLAKGNVSFCHHMASPTSETFNEGDFPLSYDS